MPIDVTAMRESCFLRPTLIFMAAVGAALPACWWAHEIAHAGKIQCIFPPMMFRQPSSAHAAIY